jgi:hypothetical protein
MKAGMLVAKVPIDLNYLEHTVANNDWDHAYSIGTENLWAKAPFKGGSFPLH